jgi:hypothetical protein
MKAPRDRSKSEMMRRLRLRDLCRLLLDRCGPELPPDDAGREYLYELLLPISVGPNADLKMPKAIELWAPWMSQDEATELVDRINRMPMRERMPRPRPLGERLNLTNIDRERLRVWSILPCDMTDQQLAEQRKAKARARVRRNRQKRGAKLRSRWLADNSKSRLKPWKTEGMSRAKWYRRQRETAPFAVHAAGETGPFAIKLSILGDRPVSRSKRHRRKSVPAQISNGKAETTAEKPESKRKKPSVDGRTACIARKSARGVSGRSDGAQSR